MLFRSTPIVGVFQELHGDYGAKKWIHDEKERQRNEGMEELDYTIETWKMRMDTLLGDPTCFLGAEDII